MEESDWIRAKWVDKDNGRRHEVMQARPELRVTKVRTQIELNEAKTVSERAASSAGSVFRHVALSSEAKRCGYAGYSTADHCIDYSVISNTRYPSRNQNRSRRNAARRMISKVSIARNRTVLTGR